MGSSELLATFASLPAVTQCVTVVCAAVFGHGVLGAIVSLAREGKAAGGAPPPQAADRAEEAK